MIYARDTIERLLAHHIGNNWRCACSYGYNSLPYAVAFLRGRDGDRAADALVAAIRSAWPAQCREDYAVARAWSGVSARLSGASIMDAIDCDALDRRRATEFADCMSLDDFVVPCPV